jgi:signal peptidase I
MSEAISSDHNKSEKEVSVSHSALWEWAKTIAYAIVLALFIRAFFFATFHVPTGSMIPTLHPGDKLIALKFVYGFPIPFTDHKILAMSETHRGDVIIFNPENIDQLDQGKDYIKRLVGLGGERVQIVEENPNGKPVNRYEKRSGYLHIDGEPLKEPGVIAETLYYMEGPYGGYEVTVPQGHYFMLGDNAENSRDSRFWGFVPNENVVGKAVFIYWPPSRMGLIE